MLHKIIKIVGWVLLAIVVIISGFFVYGMYMVKKLPWQHPVFDTARPADPGQVGDKGVLVFSKTNGFRHSSIEAGIEAIKKAGDARGWKVITTENGAFFNDDYLNRFKVVVFLSTTGDVLTPEQEKSFEKFIENGGGYVGIHAAADTEYDWLWYDKLLGTHFRDHSIFPHTPEATITTENRTHPSTKHLPEHWKKADEWYNYKNSVRGKDSLQVLMSLDEKTYDVGETKGMGGDHPIAWTNVIGKGRMFYTGLGHTDETFTDSNSLQHIIGGIEWAGKF